MRRSFCLTEQYQPRIDGGEMFTTVGGSSVGVGQNSWGWSEQRLVITVGAGQKNGRWAEQLGAGHNSWGLVRKVGGFKEQLGGL
jgi:hypothetical protein